MTRRLPTLPTIATIVALLLAGLATVAILAYVRGVEQRAYGDLEPVAVYVAVEEIPAGLPGPSAVGGGLIARELRPRSAVPAGAVAALAELDDLVTEERILPGEVIVRGRFVDPAVAVAALQIPPGLEAISLEVGVPPGVAGFVRAGDRISLIATVELPVEDVEVAPDPTTPTAPPADTDADADADAEAAPAAPTDPASPAVPASPATEILARYLLQDVEVLAVGQRIVTVEGEDGVQPTTTQVLLTLALAPVDAERLVLAIDTASLYVTLLPDGAEPVETPGRRLSELFTPDEGDEEDEAA